MPHESKLCPPPKLKPSSLNEGFRPKHLNKWRSLKPKCSSSSEPTLKELTEWHHLKAKRSSSSEPKLNHRKSRSSSLDHLAFPVYAKIKPIYAYAAASSRVRTFVTPNRIQKKSV